MRVAVRPLGSGIHSTAVHRKRIVFAQTIAYLFQKIKKSNILLVLFYILI